VNLVRRTCGYRQWDLIGIPCAHVMYAIWSDNASPQDYVNDWYTVEMYRKVYDEIVYLMPGEDQWIKIGYDHVHLPMYRIQSGRLRRLRTRGA
jgi:hypothetical protein